MDRSGKGVDFLLSRLEVKKMVLRNIDESRSQVVRFAQDLIRIPSIVGSIYEGKAQDILARELMEIDGLKIDIWEPDLKELEKYPLHPDRVDPWSYEGRPNVVGVLNGAGGGRSLILNGHIDVVSPEPISAWTHSPWNAEVEGDSLYGRGSLDMKAGLAAMVYALKTVRQTGVELKGRVIIESVVEEELGGGGTIACVLRGYKADAAILAEPTGSDAIAVGAGGSRFFKIDILGKAECPHLAHLGVDAAGLALKVYNALMELNKRRLQRLQGKHPLFETLRSGEMRGPGKCTNLVVGILRAGDFPTTLPGHAELQGRIGFPPSEKGADVEKEFEEAVRETVKDDPWMTTHPPSTLWWGSRKEAYELDPNLPFVQMVKRSAEELTEKPCELCGTPSAADGSYLTPVVDRYGGIPAVWYGPRGKGAHAADEYVEIEDLVTVTKVIALSILDWCSYEL